MFIGIGMPLTGIASALNAALSLDFRASNTLDPRVTFTRADPAPAATRFNSAGLLETFGVNLLPDTRAASQTYTACSYVPAADPWGGSSGALVTAAASTAQHINATVTTAVLTVGVASTLSAYFKPGTHTIVQLSFGSAYWGGAYANFDLTGNGTASALGGASSASITKLNDGWYKCSVTFASSLAAVSAGGGFYFANSMVSSRAPSIALNGTETVTVAGWQFEYGSTANAYSPTQGTSTSGPRFDYDPATPAGTTGGELVTTPLSGWTYSGAWVYNSGGYIDASGGIGQAVIPGISLTVGKTYRVTFTSSSTSIFNAVCGGVFQNPGAPVVGLNTWYVVCGSGTLAGSQFGFQGGANANQITNVSIQEVTFTPRGLLIEESRTNLLLQSRDMTNAAWTKTDVTPTRNQVGIDGVANSACLMTEGSVGTAMTRQDVTITAGTVCTASWVLKRGNTDWVIIGLTNGSAAGVDAWFNLATGAAGSRTNYATPTSVNSGVIALGGGWYRCWVTCSPDGVSTLLRTYVLSASANGSATRVAGATYTVDCTQNEVGAFATSIIPTTTATVTRAADNASMTGTNFSSWFNASAGTFVIDVGASAQRSTATGRVFSVSDNTANNQILSEASGGAPTTFGVYTGAVFQAQLGAALAGSAAKVAMAYATNDFAASVNGAAVATDTSGSLATYNRIQIGDDWSGGGGRALGGWIRRITFYNSRLPDATLRSLST